MSRPLVDQSRGRFFHALLVFLLGAGIAPTRADDARDALEAGRARLAEGKAEQAVERIEYAFVHLPADQRSGVLDDLIRAYELAARSAEKNGDQYRARVFRENIQILEYSRSMRRRKRERSDPAPNPTAGETEAPGTNVERVPAPPEQRDSSADPKRSGKRSAPARSKPAAPLDLSLSRAGSTENPEARDTRTGMADDSRSSVEASRLEDLPDLERTPAPQTGDFGERAPERRAAAERLKAADQAFRAERYKEAGRLYAELANEDQLPPSHHGVWAYCRFVAVARRINQSPRGPEEWRAIRAEIQEIRGLAPRIWFTEYLDRLAAERSAQTLESRGARRIAEELPASPSSGHLRAQSPADAGHSTSANWRRLETENFRIFHDDAELARRVAEVAERTRAEQHRIWVGSESNSAWTPPCDIYLYPNATIFEERTGQPPESPGFSTMGLQNGRVVARRVNLRADADRLLDTVLPHEITHVLLADLFPRNPIPKWADEGIAMLAEPPDQFRRRLVPLSEALESGRLFRLETLMTAEYPDGRYWEVFMAQSASLTHFLVQQDSPERLLQFLRRSVSGEELESALRDVYGFSNFKDLETRWLAWAGRETTDAIAAEPDDAPRR